ncbi:MAG: RICIN domain-containing protein [Mollicutes bacterium]|nr:RICIN domain-containing protein [Mollicutes bacterium]
MALIYQQGWRSPTSTAQIYIDSSRNGAVVNVTATVVCTLTYSDGYINYNGEINFNMWSHGTSASANIKGYSDRWDRNTARTRTRTCSMSFVDIGSSYEIGFNMTIPADRPAGAAFRIDNQTRTLGAPSYNAPSAPTWINISPNPCGINGAPLITWGGANAGTLGTLYYDVEVRSSTPAGGWTNWLRIANAKSGSSYQEITLSQMNVHNQKPFVGVKYQYRVRSNDGTYATSGWVDVTLSVSFGTPAAPTTYTLSNNKIKKNGQITVTWSGGNGGAGQIVSYELEYRIYNHKTSTWSEWIQGYSGNSTSYIFDLSSLYGLANDTYSICAYGDTSLCWAVAKNSTENKALIELAKYSSLGSQQCNIQYRGDGFYKITFINSGMCVEVANAVAQDGVQLNQYSDNGTAAQQWLIRKNDDNSYSFIPRLNSRLSADVRNDETKVGTPIILHTYDGTRSQHFYLNNINGGESSTALLSNGDIIQFRVRIKNNYGQYSSYLTTSQVPVRGNQMWIKVNNTWVEADTYFKVNNNWVEATPYVKIDGAWKETV